MFRPHHRPRPFTPFINWTDYRWDAAPRPSGPVRGPWNQPQNYSFLKLFAAGLAVLLGVKLLSSFRSHRGSWLGKAVLALLLIGAATAFSNRRSRDGYW